MLWRILYLLPEIELLRFAAAMHDWVIKAARGDQVAHLVAALLELDIESTADGFLGVQFANGSDDVFPC
jgi:hypothetical protein